jgi:hypothetical protein
MGYQNTAWIAVNFGFVIQIDETASPDSAPWHRTGAIYNQGTNSSVSSLRGPPATGTVTRSTPKAISTPCSSTASK